MISTVLLVSFVTSILHLHSSVNDFPSTCSPNGIISTLILGFRTKEQQYHNKIESNIITYVLMQLCMSLCHYVAIYINTLQPMTCTGLTTKVI